MPVAARHYRWDDIPKEKLNDLLERRLVTGERIMLAHVYLKKGCVVPLHRHENEQLTYILEGTLRFWLGDDQKQQLDVHAGEVLHDPLEPAAQGGGARGHARRRHLLPAAAGLARQDRRLPAGPLSVELGLEDKVALVAASSRGLGYAIAHELAAEGAAIVMCARSEGRLKEAAREIGAATGGSCRAGRRGRGEARGRQEHRGPRALRLRARRRARHELRRAAARDVRARRPRKPGRRPSTSCSRAPSS